MRTRTPISTISYNTNDFLIIELNKLVQEQVIEFWAFVEHLPEEDEKKAHKHLYIIPCSLVDTFMLSKRLEELDVEHPDLPPLGCLSHWQHSKFADWYMYALHDVDYLAMHGGECRKYHYDKTDVIASEYDYLNELIHTSDMSRYKSFKKLRDMAKSGVSFKEIFENGFIPVQQIIQYQKAYALMRFGDMNFTYRGGRTAHEDEQIMCEQGAINLPFRVDENGEILP